MNQTFFIILVVVTIVSTAVPHQMSSSSMSDALQSAQSPEQLGCNMRLYTYRISQRDGNGK